MTELFSTFETSKGLLFLQLNETNIGNDGAAALFRYVSQNCPLRRLHIADNGITKLDVTWEQISVLTELNIAVTSNPTRRRRHLIVLFSVLILGKPS